VGGTDRQKTALDISIQKQQTVQCEIITDSEQTVETEVETVTQKQQTVQCELLTDSVETVEESSGHSDTDPTDGTV
jgi:hypothetical protein